MWSLITLPRDEFKRIVRMFKNPKVPLGPKLAVAGAILYVIWPADLVPLALMPLFGWADDFALFGLTLWWLHKEADRLSRMK